MGKTIVVTGGAGGICSDICRGLGADGVNVVVADYAKEAAEKVAAEIRHNNGNGVAPRSAHYAASKAGVIAFTKSLAVELAADNITVNCVCPGATDTPMSRIGYTSEQFQKREEIPPLMDGLTHKFEIVGLVRYLL